ncbi:unnamed protein product [Mycena citricolor]|uniref:Uncharacterized protein n=1 Tax=Mycena citricolor TaxID=2018698 RepID=A0AAD2JZR8_9AGAR|nr:unnamed protein product [Mycena citricolor]
MQAHPMHRPRPTLSHSVATLTLASPKSESTRIHTFTAPTPGVLRILRAAESSLLCKLEILRAYDQTSENWDEDFEFNVHNPASGSASTDNNETIHDTTTPATPTRPRHAHHDSQESTENWDDFYEDDVDEPASSSAATTSHVSSPDTAPSEEGRKSEIARPPTPPSSSESSTHSSARTPRASKKQRLRSGSGATTRQARHRSRSSSFSNSRPSWGESSEEEDEELGFTDAADDDRTVTARTRRVFSRTMPKNPSPPPPVPPLPTTAAAPPVFTAGSPSRVLSMLGNKARWGRRKKGSSMSVGSQQEADIDIIHDIFAHAEATPRPLSASLLGRSSSQSSSHTGSIIRPALPPETPPPSKRASLFHSQPAVEIQPPSPPQTFKAATGLDIETPKRKERDSFSPTTFSLASTTSLPSTSPIKTTNTPFTLSPRAISPTQNVPPQTASLGRSSAVAAVVATGTMRRNSLGDLKIPMRISQAQDAVRRDLEMVREFAKNVEDLKALEGTYLTLVTQLQSLLDAHLLRQTAAAPPPQSSGTSFFKRHRSNTSVSLPTPEGRWKALADAFDTIKERYRVSWECAELLIDLSGVGPTSSVSAPTVAVSSASSSSSPAPTKLRARAITLSEDAKAPIPSSASLPMTSAPSLAWRASTTGRNSSSDLSSRQLVLLKEMLSSSAADDSFATDDGMTETGGTVVNRDWRWGADAMGSTLTLPSEESVEVFQNGGTKQKKRRRMSSKMRMSGFRDLLKSLAKGNGSSSSTSESTASIPGRRRAKTSVGPESASTLSLSSGRASPFDALGHGKPPGSAAAEPRRPSLASIFRLGRNKTPPVAAPAPEDEEEDWDRISSDAEPPELTTVRARSPYGMPPGSSHISFVAGTRGGARLPDVTEDPGRQPKHSAATVRSIPPDNAPPPGGKLSLTPENIKPLLENSREVYGKLCTCVEEVRRLVEGGDLL